MADDNLVEFRDVTFAYPAARGERVILDRVSLEVPRGKVTALMGASVSLRRVSKSSHMRVSTTSGSLRVTTTSGFFLTIPDPCLGPGPI